MTLIRDKIGGLVSIPRERLRLAIERAHAGSNICVLLGPSGCGKTVAAKAYSVRTSDDSQLLWWSARSFEGQDFTLFEAGLRLNHGLQDLLDFTPYKRCLAVVDGIDKLSDSDLGNVMILIKSLRLDETPSPWRLLVTCQPEAWQRVRAFPTGVGIQLPSPAIVEVGNLSDNETKQVVKAIPALRPLTRKEDLWTLLHRPKLLER